MSGLDPNVRFDKHKAGLKSNAHVYRYGLILMPDLNEAYNPMSYKNAVDMEIEPCNSLREVGFGIWQA
jgi:hypothetical protein